ncbi:peptidase C10 family [Bacteroides intestinalis CAG:315]|uniref:T9SS C-terminal target domain-containing protein n=2 Tax=Bacteroides intestinalis TaxID=329854 RepID=A0A412YFJ7_9BACE|nr:T9SS C-terminal target domain-containing protein [Bacteroides intestinalis]RHA59359.1 T9SS C-terminal target domain-containing protein [Bacteroides intestinalis]CDD98274.1 peptidase C10 family [Bacteroides intestinalis CAG:315]
MMPMKKLLLLSLVLLCSLTAWTAQRSPEEALSIARSFFMQSSGAVTRNAGDIHLVAVSNDLLKSVSTRSVEGTAFYIYNYEQSAYVIVSGDDRMKPVLGYSDNGSFITENLPVNILGWLELYNAAYAELGNGEKAVTEPKLLTKTSFPASVSPLLGSICWDQSAPYNNNCPLYQGERCVTGCVATAMAMILKYHEYPVKGKGTHSYKAPNGIECSFDYGNTTFDWNNMLPQYSGTYAAEQADAVAQLMLACGVAVDMQYSPYSSGAYSYQVGQTLIDYFGYDGNLGLVYRQYFTSAEWMNLIKSEINEKRPIYYFGSSDDGGHAFVFDGYDTQDMVHVNWGWSGMNNGYFEVASLNPDSPGIGGGSNLGGGFTRGQGMYLGIQPPTSSSNFTSHFYMTELEANKTEVVKGEAFKLEITGFTNMSMVWKNGDLAVIAERDGQQSVLGQDALKMEINTFDAYNFSFSGLTIPNNFADGTYSVYVATKDEREATWSRVRGYVGSETQLILVVSGNKCTLTPFSGNLDLEKDIEVGVELVHSLYSGLKGDFKMLVSNKSTSDEYYGLVGIALFTADETPRFVAIVGDAQVEVKPGTINRELVISGDLVVSDNSVLSKIPAGEYYVRPCIDWGVSTYVIGELTPVTIKEVRGTADLKVSQPHLEKEQLQVGETLKFLADLSLSGDGNVYTGTLTAAIFENAIGYAYSVHYQNVFVEADQTKNLVMEIPLSLGEGRHAVCLYKSGTNGDLVTISTLYFSVGPATGIEDEVADEDGLVIYQQPVDEILNIRTSNAVQMISVYNLSGQQMIQQKEPGDKKEYSIPVKGLTAGYYIVVLQSADGKVYKSKFMKR